MRDIRDTRLAKLLVEYSINLQPGENCLIHAVDVPLEFGEELVDAVCAVGGQPQVELTSVRLERALIEGATEASLMSWADCDMYRMRKMDAFIGVRGPINTRETAGLSDGKLRLYRREYVQKVHMDIRLPSTKWVVLRYPTELMAYNASMSLRDFEDYFYKVTTEVDYHAMSEAMKKAKTFLEHADRVHITGPGTDLTFSIRGMGAVPCDGEMNIPDGEIYSCPLRDSVEGYITYNTLSTYEGFTFTDVRLTFSKGRIVEASANNTARINQILNTDEGARYIGEFALGCNPGITFPMDNTLFDEKIMGSFHFTPGNAYEDCDNGNRSAVHWDLVSIQTEQMGGGEIRIDGELVRSNGKFVHEAFNDLNPESLLGS
ncbi:MAG: aminopeptidase [Spirochaetales bacterium]|jgi:aminopeptidase|nr:aminopeptidase [Spirochaetales bacterium]